MALQMKSVAENSAAALALQEKQLAEANTRLHTLQVHASELDVLIARLKLTESQADGSVQECEDTIKFCRQTEGLMTQCKSNTTIVRGKCTWLEELVAGKDYVQSKADYVNVLLDCIQFVTIDVSVAAIVRSILNVLIVGDQTHLLQGKDLSQKVSNVNNILGAFDRLKIASTF